MLPASLFSMLHSRNLLPCSNPRSRSMPVSVFAVPNGGSGWHPRRVITALARVANFARFPGGTAAINSIAPGHIRVRFTHPSLAIAVLAFVHIGLLRVRALRFSAGSAHFNPSSLARYGFKGYGLGVGETLIMLGVITALALFVFSELPVPKQMTL